MLNCAGLAAGADIDDARLLNAASDRSSWLTYGHDYASQRYSALTQINAWTVSRLVPR